jgi:hypothetical protein
LISAHQNDSKTKKTKIILSKKNKIEFLPTSVYAALPNRNLLCEFGQSVTGLGEFIMPTRVIYKFSFVLFP